MREQSQPNGVSVHSGFPNPATDRSLQALDIHQLLVKRPASTFFMGVAGDQWGNVGVFDGDIAVVDRALDASANDLVVWWGGGEFCISTLSRSRPGSQIWGVVTAVIHRYRP